MDFLYSNDNERNVQEEPLLLALLNSTIPLGFSKIACDNFNEA